MRQSRFPSFLSLALAFLVASGCWLSSGSTVLAQSSLAQEVSSPMLAAIFSFSGTRPANLGVTNKQLAACPNTPNCVSSQSDDSEHQVSPLTFSAAPEKAFADLKGLVSSLERAEVVTATDDYLHVEFTSKLMGFVDDVEFYLDREANVIHVRSASRLGKSDLGVNRKRVEEIRSRLATLEQTAS